METRGLMTGIGVCLLMGLVAAVCAPLQSFDLLVPKDGGGIRIASGIAYGSGPRRKLDIYAPRNRKAGANLPIVIFFYGGSWASGTRTGYNFVGRALAAQGFLVVIPDYRIGPENVYPDFVTDGADTVRWMIAHGGSYGGATDRIVLSGHSAGAYSAAMLAVDERWLGHSRRAIRGFVGIAGPYDFAPFDVPASKAAFGRWPVAAETQPVTWAGAGDPPTLLLIGDKDETVRAHNSEALADRLRSANVPVQIKRYVGIGHVGMVTSFARPLRFRAPVLEDSTRFMRAVTDTD
jgi:acetyl esterase/lipase